MYRLRLWRFPSARLVLIAGLLLIASVPAFAQGRIDGLVKQKDGTPVGGAVVVLNEKGSAEITTSDGKYAFDNLQAGSYTLTISLADHTATDKATVTTGVVTVATTVEWTLKFSDTVTVTGVSKHVERIVESPAAVTRIDGEDLAREAVDSQLPRRLTRVPGVELTQSSLYTFSLNTRGFNTSNGRHFPVFIDGRDASTPIVLGNQEWGALPLPIDEMSSIEVVRGPAAALYGSGAFSGVVNIISKSPAESKGGKVRFTFGELSTAGWDARYAAAPKTGWSYRLAGAMSRSRDFTKSRLTAVEYDGLAKEAVALPDEAVQLMSGSGRVDYAAGGRQFTLEAGTARAENVLAVTSLGRSFSSDVKRPWARANFSLPGWNVMAFYTGRDADDLRNLGGGTGTYLVESNIGGEVQHHRFVARGRGQVVVGASFARQSLDSANPTGTQTVFNAAQTARQEALFAQFDWNFTPRFKAVGSGRWDDSTLHDGRFSPRAALVFVPTPGQTLRVNYSNAFQSPSVVEYFLNTQVAAPVDLSPLQTALAPLLNGVSLGFNAIPLLAVGNPHLKVERIETFEAGYTGVIGTKVMATASAFYNRRHDFTTNLVPLAGSSLGRVNPDFQAYKPPAALSATAAATVVGALGAALPASLFAAMSNDPAGKPVFALLTFGNFGEATDRGVELGVTAWARPDLRIEASLTLSGFTVKSQAAESVISPNAPTRQFTVGATYAGTRWNGSATLRAINAFDWAAGIYVGRVPAYAIVDAAAGYTIGHGLRAEVDASNLFNKRHYEMFGGSLLGRRVLGSLVYTW
ncbi:MAG: TonB-dependent receptor [Acidobacteria bacterium]|nr:MAG: TonB-dependent receptor [Acidobacteriota bacterium]